MVKSDGVVICSTPLDIQSDYALDSFAALAEKEFNLVDYTLSHHALQIRLSKWMEKIGQLLEKRDKIPLKYSDYSGTGNEVGAREAASKEFENFRLILKI